jgi:hypothetical protein
MRKQGGFEFESEGGFWRFIRSETSHMTSGLPFTQTIVLKEIVCKGPGEFMRTN